MELKPCPACDARAGELRKSEFGSRFPYHVKCGKCGWMTEFVTLPAVAVKLWNEAKKPRKAKQRRQ